jgi:hypothetical protein
MNKTQDQVFCINRKSESDAPHRSASEFINRFAQGCGGRVTSWDYAFERENPVCIRGMTFRNATKYCMETNREFYYIDNGYFGNPKTKFWFRIIKNHVHDIREIISRPFDRLKQAVALADVPLEPFTTGKKIIVAPPSPKSFTLWGIDYQTWVDSTVEELKKYTDRTIEIRIKRDRPDRLVADTMQQALADDVHCLVTFNSVAAVEALMLGKPVITLGPNAAGQLARNSLADVENLYIPSEDERLAWLAHLSYSQFTYEEMSNGFAWRILNP